MFVRAGISEKAVVVGRRFHYDIFSKYIWHEEAGILPGLIGDDLMPLGVHSSPEQQFFAGGHLMGLSLISDDADCSVTQTWFNDTGGTGSITLPDK